jgi:hypothetical protein
MLGGPIDIATTADVRVTEQHGTKLTTNYSDKCSDVYYDDIVLCTLLPGVTIDTQKVNWIHNNFVGTILPEP